MTETPAAIMAGPLPRNRPMPTGYVGRKQDVWPHFDVRLVNENDEEVPAGSVGELVLRCDMPWAIAPEYLNNPVATTAAWRNGWFHTGDLLRQTTEGDYLFVDRVKDAIRRRGENISSHEVESEAGLFEGVQACAAYGAASEFGEQEVMLAVQPQPGCPFDPRALVDFLIPRLPHFMVPRYVRVVDQLSYTPSNKVEKSGLRKEGVTADTWDREAAGIVLRRAKLS